MPADLSVALFMLAQAATASQPADAAYGPAAPPVAKLAPPSATSERECTPQPRPPNGNEIVVCAVKPEGYRLPPDIVEARRLKKQGDTGRPHNPHENYADHSCATVGPMGCRGTPTINLLAVAAVAAEISKRLAAGQEIGSIFGTTPTSSEYQFYREAKRRREAKEAQAAATAAQAKAKAEDANKTTSGDIDRAPPKPAAQN